MISLNSYFTDEIDVLRRMVRDKQETIDSLREELHVKNKVNDELLARVRDLKQMLDEAVEL